MFKNTLSFLFEITKVVVISLAIIIPVRYFLIQPFYVKGASMQPTFHESEYLIIDEISYRFGEPERGDVVVFRYPLNPQEYFIKRVIGLPGEKVEIKDGRVYVYNDKHKDGTVLQEDYLPPGTDTPGMNEDYVILGEDEYFLLGDNRNSSKDSRSFGPVKESFVIGKVLLRGWPFDKFGFFETPKYQY